METQDCPNGGFPHIYLIKKKEFSDTTDKQKKLSIPSDLPSMEEILSKKKLSEQYIPSMSEHK